MSESSGEIIGRAKEWLVHADADLRLAKHAFKLIRRIKKEVLR